MMSIGYRIITGINYFFRIVNLAMTVYCLLSFFARGSSIYQMLDRFFEPLRRPFMPITMYLAQRGFPFDVSIILLWIALNMIQSILTQVIYLFMGVW